MKYEVIVVGGGHAGCEAALATARKGHSTLLITGNINNIADMPCNPSIGGPAKGVVVREIDALGGEMGKNADKAAIQVKMLNTKKGPAVWALRAQEDKNVYPKGIFRKIPGRQFPPRRALFHGPPADGGGNPLRGRVSDRHLGLAGEKRERN